MLSTKTWSDTLEVLEDYYRGQAWRKSLIVSARPGSGEALAVVANPPAPPSYRSRDSAGSNRGEEWKSRGC